MSAKLLIKSARTKFCCYKREPNCSPSSFHSIDPPTFHAAIFSFQRIDPVEVILMKSEVKSHRSTSEKPLAQVQLFGPPKNVYDLCLTYSSFRSDQQNSTKDHKYFFRHGINMILWKLKQRECWGSSFGKVVRTNDCAFYFAQNGIVMLSIAATLPCLTKTLT